MKLRSVARAVALMLVVASANGRAAPAVRTTVVQHGGFVLIGNTLAHDCAAATPAPVVGSVGSCGVNTADSAPDVPWRADSPAVGMAEASTAITPAQARSSAVLALPPGATVTHAFLCWAATLPQGSSAADGDAVLDRPGATPFSATVSSTASWVTGSSYQAVADVTDLVRGNGPGAYRVSGVSTQAPANLNSSTYFAGWRWWSCTSALRTRSSRSPWGTAWTS